MEWTRTKCGVSACVEVAPDDDFPTLLRLRSSEYPRQMVMVTRDEFDAFVAGVKAGDFDHLVQIPA